MQIELLNGLMSLTPKREEDVAIDCNYLITLTKIGKLNATYNELLSLFSYPIIKEHSYSNDSPIEMFSSHKNISWWFKFNINKKFGRLQGTNFGIRILCDTVHKDNPIDTPDKKFEWDIVGNDHYIEMTLRAMLADCSDIEDMAHLYAGECATNGDLCAHASFAEKQFCKDIILFSSITFDGESLAYKYPEIFKINSIAKSILKRAAEVDKLPGNFPSFEVSNFHNVHLGNNLGKIKMPIGVGNE